MRDRHRYMAVGEDVWDSLLVVLENRDWKQLNKRPCLLTLTGLCPLKSGDFFLRPLGALRTRVWKCEFPRDWICLPWPALGSSVCLYPQPKGTESPMDNLDRESEEHPEWMQRQGKSCVGYDAGFLSWLRPRQRINILWKF